VAASADDIRRAARPETDMVAVDEAHFFDADLTGVADRLARDGVVVVVAGLDVTFAGRPFEPLPSLMALAERVDKLTARWREEVPGPLPTPLPPVSAEPSALVGEGV
jgi:thymidine kinase